jgi:hypothetical protein
MGSIRGRAGSSLGCRDGRRGDARRALRSLAIGAACIAAASCEPFVEFNPDADIALDFASAAHRLAFGTSTGDSTENSVTIEPGGATLRAMNATNNAGKIAGSEDGITYWFREVDASRNFKLSASVRVIRFGGTGTQGEVTSNGQEGFGLMARDYVPQFPGYTMAELEGASEYHAGASGGSGNMILVGGVKRGVRVYYRTGVVDPSGECVTDPLVISNSSNAFFTYFPAELGDYSMYPTLPDRPDFPTWGSTYRLTLEKNNSGFKAIIDPPPGKGEVAEYFVEEPDLVFSIKKDKYYVGFFAARAAEIQVSDISYYESDAASDAPRVTPAPVLWEPSLEVISPAVDSDGQYRLCMTSNVRGSVAVRQNGVPLPERDYMAGEWVTEPSSSAVTPYSLFEIPTYALAEGDNVFDIAFYPQAGQSITSAEAVRKVFVVRKKAYFDAATPLYAGPAGSSRGAGTRASPLDLDTAIRHVLPGQTIVMLDGVYAVSGVLVERYNDGAYNARKALVAEHRDMAIIDFQKNPQASGFVHMGNYWTLEGFHVRNTGDKKKGLTLMGSNNVARWIKTYGNGDTGFQISGRNTEPKRMWPKNNLVEYCESYDNKDAAMIDADGFAAKLTVGEGNRFSWCVSHNNNDDGWDLFTKKETGPIGVVTIENCVAYQNGLLMDGTKTLAGRNGFKLGGEGLAVAHVVTNCLAFNNGAHGFTSNSNPAIKLSYCTSYDNGGPFNLKAGADSRNFTIYDGTGVILNLSATLTGILSLYSEPQIEGVNRKEDKVQLRLPADGYAWLGAGAGSSEGTATKNKNGNVLSVADMQSTAVPLYSADMATPVTERGFVKRKPDGSFDLGNSLRPIEGRTAFPTGAVF